MSHTPKVWGGLLFKKPFWANLWGLVLRQGSIMSWGSFINAFCSSLNSVNLKIFPNHGGIFTWRLRLNPFMELWNDLSLRLIVNRFQGLFRAHISPDLVYWLITWKLTPEIRGWIYKTPFAHYASGRGDSMENCLFRYR